jgi:hypothetical protein
MEFIDDYLNFIKKWYSIRNNRVLFINYEDFLNISDNSLLTNKLSEFFHKKPKKLIYNFTISKREYYINKKYMSLYSKKELDIIKNNPIYQELINYIL